MLEELVTEGGAFAAEVNRRGTGRLCRKRDRRGGCCGGVAVGARHDGREAGSFSGTGVRVAALLERVEDDSDIGRAGQTA